MLVALFFAFTLEFVSLISPNQIDSANLTMAKDTLQSSRMSFNGRVKAPTLAGNSHVWVNTGVSGNFTSTSTAGLKPGDSLTIGATSGYIIASIIDDDEFTITTTLAAGDADPDDVIYFKSRPQHVISFKTTSSVPNGFFRVLIQSPAINSNDGLPDISGFDFNIAPTISAINSPDYTFTTVNTIPSGSPGCTSFTNFHCFDFYYTGAGPKDTNIILTIGNINGTNTPIAPAPSAGRVANFADPYVVKIKNFANATDPETNTATDEITAAIAVIESVRVTAIVPTHPIFLTATLVPHNWLLENLSLIIILLLVFGLPLHLFMTFYGTKTRFTLLFRFLPVLFFPFLGKKDYQTVPFVTLDMFDPDKLDSSWQTKVSDIKGFYSLTSPLINKIFITITGAGRHWKNIIVDGAILPKTCLFPILDDPKIPSNRLRQRFMTYRSIPLAIACITSGLALTFLPNYFFLIYLYLSLQLAFSEYLYPRLQRYA